MRRYTVLVIGMLAAAVCARLGLWQLDRLEQRRAMNDQVAKGLAALPVELSELDLGTPARLESAAYRPVYAAGRLDFERELIVVARSLNGVPGVHVVTPLVLPGGDAVLVERGWSPSPDGRSVDLSLFREPPEADVSGTLLIPRGDGTTAAQGWPLRVRAADPAALGARYPYRLLPVVVRRGETSGQVLRPVPLPELTDGPHLSYAVQWFAFGVIALVGSVVLVRKAVKEGEGR